MPYPELAGLLQREARLSLPPVALAYVPSQPTNIEHISQAVPSFCTFWRQAETQVFYASAEDHFGCPIGALVAGFQMPDEKMQELMGLVQQMCAIEYIQEAEVPHIPRVQNGGPGLVYGPLAEFPLEADLALFWVTPRQAMLLEEATGATEWRGTAPTSLFGRPACGALAAAANSGAATLSLGCMGMRTYTEIPENLTLLAVPGKQLAGLTARVQTVMSANDKMQAFYQGNKAKYE